LPLPPVTMPLDQALKLATKWKDGPPTEPGHYVVQYHNANLHALDLIAGSTLLQYPESYNVKRHFRFYP